MRTVVRDNFLFLGASGGIGRMLRAAYEHMPPEAVQMHWQFRTAVAGQKNLLVWPDFSEPSPLLEYSTKHGPFRALFVFTGGASGANKDDESAMQAHVDVTRDALNAAFQAGVRRVFVASSSAVYGPGDGTAFGEGKVANPSHHYGQAKLRMENMCREISTQTGLEICALRIGNVAGADMLLKSAAVRGDAPLQLDIFADGCGPRRSYIGPVSLRNVLIGLARAREKMPPALNVAGAVPVDMKDLLAAVDVPWVARACDRWGHQDVVLDTSALVALLPDVDLGQGAEALISELRDVGGVT